ncbi:methyltransferase family protein [Zhihengliuella halotolerans]|uniref:Methyltransferase family protein n=2 Tax=Zhihengliuella halotolerans TaxID=370736 RepID=A0A4Q8AA22_9MICC|nr:methyltransferase family protein [Zhihengliuella halotolerans]
MLGRMIDLWRQAFSESKMVGWDFSCLDGRMTADEPWWDFEEDCRAEMARARLIVDLGTGGGERLQALLGSDGVAARRIVATEGWQPNVRIAREVLSASGVEVVQYDAERDSEMPFDNESIDLLMCRHEAIDAREIARILAPGGRLLMQQVDGYDAEEIHEWFDVPFEYPHVTAGHYVDELESAGLRIDQVNNWRGTMEFKDVTALVTYLALVPWDAPCFTVDAHADQLATLDASRPIRVTQRRFRVYAAKP